MKTPQTVVNNQVSTSNQLEEEPLPERLLNRIKTWESIGAAEIVKSGADV
jgi:hypothetical protein